MKFYKILLVIISSVFLISSCSKDQTIKEKTTKESKDKSSGEKASDNDSGSTLSKYDLDSDNPSFITLPPELKEISGIVMTPDGRMFGHQDESGIVYQIDIKTGKIIKKFAIGKPPVKNDFEDIAYANNKFYMVQSKGEIYEFQEGSDGESVEYKVYKTGLKGANDVEGLCFDPETNSLLLACKGASGTEDASAKAVYSFSLESMKLSSDPKFLITKSDIKNLFNPSGIQKNPVTGTYFIIAANGNSIVELSKEGSFLDKQNLPGKIHIQPEGIAFSSDGTLYISNEGKSGNGTIVIYPYKK